MDYVAFLVVKNRFGEDMTDQEKDDFSKLDSATVQEVNEELDGLGECVRDIVKGLKPGGRIAVMTFHSLADRIVKQTFQDLATACVCDKRLPVCVCGRKKKVELGNKKPIVADEEECLSNPRAKSAKLRIAEKIRLFDGEK